MKSYESLNEFRTDLFDVAVPDEWRDMRRTIATGGSAGSLVTISEFLTTIYQNRALASVELMQVAAGGLGVFAQSGFLDIGKDGTAAQMRMALLRDAGEQPPEGMSWPDPSEDPNIE